MRGDGPDAPEGAASERRFHVEAAEVRGPGRTVAAASFAEAALEAAEVWPGAEAALRLRVRDLETGREECFALHLSGIDPPA